MILAINMPTGFFVTSMQVTAIHCHLATAPIETYHDYVDCLSLSQNSLFPSELSAAGAQRGVRSLLIEPLPLNSQQST